MINDKPPQGTNAEALVPSAVLRQQCFPETCAQNLRLPNNGVADTWNRRRHDLPLAGLVAQEEKDPMNSFVCQLCKKFWPLDSKLSCPQCHKFGHNNLAEAEVPVM